TSAESSARTVGLLGASGASRLIHRLPRHSSLRLTAATTLSAISLGEVQLSRSCRAAARMAGSWTSIRSVSLDHAVKVLTDTCPCSSATGVERPKKRVDNLASL